MSKKEIQGIIILMVTSIIIIGVIFLLTRKTEEEKYINTIVSKDEIIDNSIVQTVDSDTKVNVSSKLNEDKSVNGINFKNIQLVKVDKLTILSMDVENTTGKDIKDTMIKINLLDQNGNKIKAMSGIISAVKNGETVKLKSIANGDYTNAYDLKIAFK